MARSAPIVLPRWGGAHFALVTQGGARASLALGWLVDGPLALTRAVFLDTRSLATPGVPEVREYCVHVYIGDDMVGQPSDIKMAGFLGTMARKDWKDRKSITRAGRRKLSRPIVSRSASISPKRVCLCERGTPQCITDPILP